VPPGHIRLLRGMIRQTHRMKSALTICGVPHAADDDAKGSYLILDSYSGNIMQVGSK
jgi:hypothetical protein